MFNSPLVPKFDQRHLCLGIPEEPVPGKSGGTVIYSREYTPVRPTHPNPNEWSMSAFTCSPRRENPRSEFSVTKLIKFQ